MKREILKNAGLLNEIVETVEAVFEQGLKDPSQENFDKLMKIDKKGYYIYLAGDEWKQFDFKKGFDKLLEVDKDGFYIYLAGADWKQFDYKKGFDKLLEVDKEGESIYRAGTDWKHFDHKKGLKKLSELSDKDYYKFALKNWPKSATEKLNQTEKQDEVKIPTKRKKL